MPLFPDRPNSPDRSLSASSGNRDIMLITPTLSEPQRIQLDDIFKRYMRDNKLIGYENKMAVKPVIRQCILDGLEVGDKKRAILPNDDLDDAFKKGYSKRRRLLGIMERELAGLPAGDPYQGPLAITKGVAQAATREYQGRLTLPELTAGKMLAATVEVRRPIFRQAIKFCRDQIQEQIPGSQEVKLTPVQEAGLLRNLIFSWGVFEEVQLLLETGDFSNYKQQFNEADKADSSKRWAALAQTLGITSPDAVLYFSQLADQVGSYIAGVPDKPKANASELEIASHISTTYRQLDPNFLVTNPFQNYQPLSENPNDKEGSIWTPNRTTTFVFNGAVYRMPTETTLNLAAFLQSVNNPQHARQLRIAAVHVGDLLKEASMSEQRREGLRAEIKDDEADLADIYKSFSQGEVPPIMRMDPDNVLDYVKKQKEVMADEKDFLSLVQGYREQFQEMGVRLLGKYRDGRVLKGARDLGDLALVHYGPGILRKETMAFLRIRVIKRMRALEDLVVSPRFADSLQSRMNPFYTSRFFEQALDTTVLDALAIRTNFWLAQSVVPHPQLSEDDQRASWKVILQEEARKADKELTERASFHYQIKAPDIIQATTAEILADKADYTTRRINRITDLQNILEAGEIPIDDALWRAYQEKGRSDTIKTVSDVIAGWTNAPPLASRLRIQFADDFRKPLPGKRDDLRFYGREPFGVVAMAAVGLAKLAPQEVSEDFKLIVDPSLKRTVHMPRERILSRQDNKLNLPVLDHNFQVWLDSVGVDFSDKEYKRIVKSATIYELERSSLQFHTLDAIKPELAAWYALQEVALDTQLTALSSHLIKGDPMFLLQGMERAVTAKKIRDARYSDGLSGGVAAYMRPLRELGLIITEPPI